MAPAPIEPVGATRGVAPGQGSIRRHCGESESIPMAAARNRTRRGDPLGRPRARPMCLNRDTSGSCRGMVSIRWSPGRPSGSPLRIGAPGGPVVTPYDPDGFRLASIRAARVSARTPRRVLSGVRMLSAMARTTSPCTPYVM